jgi:hypothetical protein
MRPFPRRRRKPSPSPRATSHNAQSTTAAPREPLRSRRACVRFRLGDPSDPPRNADLEPPLQIVERRCRINSFLPSLKLLFRHDCWPPSTVVKGEIPDMIDLTGVRSGRGPPRHERNRDTCIFSAEMMLNTGVRDQRGHRKVAGNARVGLRFQRSANFFEGPTKTLVSLARP